MRALHVVPYFAPAYRYGGPPRSVLGLCQALGRAGVDVQVFTTTADGAADFPASGPETDRFDGVAVRYFPRAFPRRLFGAAGLARALGAEIGRYDLAHVHGLWNAPGWAAARHARRAGVPYVVSPRGMLEAGALGHHRGRKRIAYRVLERRHLARAHLLVATSPAEAADIARRRLGVPVATVPNAVAVPVIDPARRASFHRRLGVSPEAPLVAFLGRIHPIKRLDLLAAAFRRVREAHPEARLVIAGPDEDGHRRRVEALLAPVASAVHWTGALGEDDRWALLASARALVMCSDSESFGMSVLEAMASATPVVVTRTCPWEEVEAAGCGFWVPQTADALAAALGELVGDAERARAMGQRGRARAQEVHSWDAVAGTLVEQYRRVIAAGRGAARVV